MEINEEKILTFLVNDEYYAADIMEVERILGYGELTALPESPHYMMGLMKYEGTILPVISLRRRFQLEDKFDSNNKIIVVKRDYYRVGVLVDQVTEVKNIDKTNLEKPIYIEGTIASRYIKGILREEENIIILLSLENILTQNEKDLIEQGI